MSKKGVIASLSYRKPHKRNKYEEREGVIGKICTNTNCQEWKPLDEFSFRDSKKGTRNSHCKYCKSVYKKGWDASNTEYNQAYHQERKQVRNKQAREWKQNNPERNKEITSLWKINNREKSRLYDHRRRARIACLPYDFTDEQADEVLNIFDGKCPWTSSTDIQFDHVIPIAIGHGGTTLGNMIPMRSDLNNSKNDSNVFEWFEANRQRFELSQERFDNIIDYLASANAMTVEEYRAHVNWCHANPRSLDELEAN
jgi:hypothetical protein